MTYFQILIYDNFYYSKSYIFFDNAQSLMHHIQFLNITKVWKIMHRAIKYIYDMIRKKIFKNMHICHISVIYYGILDFNSQRFYFTVICKNYQ